MTKLRNVIPAVNEAAGIVRDTKHGRTANTYLD